MGTTHGRSHEDATHIYVPRQIVGDDCGIYVCLFADLISQGRQIGEAEQGWIANAREQLQQQLKDKRYHPTTPGRCSDTTKDEYGAFTNTSPRWTPDEEDTEPPDYQQAETRKSGRIKRTRGYRA